MSHFLSTVDSSTRNEIFCKIRNIVNSKSNNNNDLDELESLLDQIDCQVMDDEIYPINLYKSITCHTSTLDQSELLNIKALMDKIMIEARHVMTHEVYGIIMAIYKNNISLTDTATIFNMSVSDIVVKIGTGINILRNIYLTNV